MEVYDQVFHLALQESRVKVKIKAAQRKLKRDKFFTYHYIKKKNKCIWLMYMYINIFVLVNFFQV